MKKIPFLNRSMLSLLFLILAIISGLLIFYPKWLIKIRSNTQGDMIIYNELDTTCNIKILLNDSLHKLRIDANSAIDFKIIHKIKNNNIEVTLSNFNIMSKDTFSLPWDEGCGIYIGIDSPMDSLGNKWDNDSTYILNDSLGGLYLRKPVIVLNKNIRLKYTVQQLKIEKYIL